MSELSLGQIKGLTVNSNVVSVPAGNTLHAPGHVIQVVSFSTSTPFATSSASYVDSGLSVSITPKFATSKLVISITQPVTNDASGGGANLAMFRDSTQIAVIAAVFGFNMPAYYRGVQSSTVMETAGSTTARTYKTQIAKGTGAGNVAAQYDSSTSTITVWEIAA